MKITNEILREFKNRLINKNFSTNTIQNYTGDIEKFLNFIKNRNGLGIVSENEITMKEIESRKTVQSQTRTPRNSIYYTKQPTISPSTIQTKIIAIKSFLKFLNIIYGIGIDYNKKCNFVGQVCWYYLQTFFGYVIFSGKIKNFI